ncbi:MAG TPA: FecR domain-containing protein [Sunxiuqinia sp.]|nr:FecR domain-containing protein [Sunxiuqinia sp.]
MEKKLKILIEKYREGQLSLEEELDLAKRISDPSNLEVEQFLQTDFDTHVNSAAIEERDMGNMLHQIHHQINLRQSEQSDDVPTRKLQRTIPLLYRIAAVLIVPLLIASLYLFFSGNQFLGQHQIAERQVYTKPGTVTQIDLPDGSKVWLNDGTTIRYPEKFTGHDRRLSVDGEAYFKVKKDPSHPFIVQNPMMTTVVTGTTFNLNAYSADHYFEATLVEGHIHLQRKNQKVEVKPGEQIRYNASNNRLVRRQVKPQIYSSWIDGKLIMVDEPLNDAVKKLGRWYNVDFELADKSLNQYLLTATIKNEKLEQTLQNIAYALPVQCTVKERIVNNQPQKTVYIMGK